MADIEKTIKINKGDIIRLEYSAWTADNNELFDTSIESVAKDGGLLTENVTYGPIPLLVGSGRLFEGLDEAIMNSFVGEEREIVIPPEKAAGPRDPKLVEQLPVRDFLKQDIEPKIGMEVNIKNRVGTVIGITPRVVRVDFNRRFAGKSLKYKFVITCKLVDLSEKILALIQMDYGSADGFIPTVDGEVVSIVLPDVCKYDQKWLLAKYKIVADLREALGVKTIRFVEEYLKKEEEKKEELKEEAKEEKKAELAEEELPSQ
ncbi:MAG: peptidylprolyl isomerase [Methanomassiliicoccales archaeon]|nr:peptidylprolyl isomerase [Methanomassiliicoccales archaeon]